MKLTLLALLAAAVWAQTPPAFDVVSLKPSGPRKPIMLLAGDHVTVPLGPFRYTPGRVTCHQSLAAIVREAFFLKDWQVSGPDWMELEEYQFDATMPADTTRARARLMLQTMLAERFGLKFHREPKDVPVYALVVGKNGPRLEEVVPNPGRFDYGSGHGEFHATAIPMPAFANILTNSADRPVVDATGIQGAYKIKLAWTPSESGQDNGLLDALPQLGLRLEKRTMPFEILVIDHVERVPTVN
ncbi:conserved exported hypothetical protein [Candidatus Sulfopaludibacter sp. SbA3]|nr:conserved exported hypothetical protein [Candidatus Sulfopaludibacter sp. SbA3]